MSILDKSARKPQLDQARLMVQAQKAFGIGVPRQMLEIMRLSKGASALSAYEYYYYKLCDPSLGWEDKCRYLGDERSRAVFLLANKMTWWDAAEDKLNFHALMEAQGYRTPRFYAVAHSERRHRSAAALTDATAVHRWLLGAPMPLFAKPAVASHGVAAVMITSVDSQAQTLTTDSGETHAIADFVSEIAEYISGAGFLFQEALTPAAEVARLTGGRLSTLRVLVMVGPNGPTPLAVICRVPAGTNRVDNFRKPGNLIAAVDAAGGFGPVSRGVSFEREILEAHPDTGAPFGSFRYPDAEAAVALAIEGSAGFPGLHIQSWDIAACADGPVVLEMNPGGNANLIQLAREEGMLTDQFQDWVRWCAGLKLNTFVGKARDRALKLAA